MVRIFDQTELSSALLCENTDFLFLHNEDVELFIASLVLNLRSARASSKPVEVPENITSQEQPEKKEKVEKKEKTKKVKKTEVVPPPDVDPVEMEKNCTGEFSIATDSACQNGTCKGKKKKECTEKIKEKVEKKEVESKTPRKLDKFGFDVNSNTGKMNAMLTTGEFSKKEIVEKLGCAEGSLNVHFGNLRKKGFKLKENKEGKWKLTKTKIK
jgi:biotin operon repressor